METKTLLEILNNKPTKCNFENIFENAEELQVRLFFDNECRKKDLWRKFADSLSLKDIVGCYEVLLNNQKLVFKTSVCGISSKASDKIIKGYPKNKTQLAIYVSKLAGADFDKVIKKEKWYKPNEIKKYCKANGIALIVGYPYFPIQIFEPLTEIVLEQLRKIAPKGIPSNHKRPDQYFYMVTRDIVGKLTGLENAICVSIGDAISNKIKNDPKLSVGLENIITDADMVSAGKLTYQMLPKSSAADLRNDDAEIEKDAKLEEEIVNTALTKVTGRTLKVKSQSKPIRYFIVDKVVLNKEKLVFTVHPKTGKGKGGEFEFYIQDVGLLLEGKDIIMPIKKKPINFKLSKR